MTNKTDSVLIVDDEFLIQELFSMAMEDMGLNVCGKAATAEQAIDLAKEHRPSIILMDMRLQGHNDGVDAARAIKAMGAKIIFITGSREPTTIDRINSGHPSAILFKPVTDRELRRTVEDVLAR
jgi:DNA-binding NarL/FixJ family response regulator